MSGSDSLSDFTSESVLGEDVNGAPRTDVGMVTLAELAACDVPLKWYEAVAIVQETCDVAASSAFGVHIPELGGIEITERGSVRVQPGKAQDDAVSRAAHILAALLSDPDLPVRLRLLIEVTSSTPRYSSLAEFSKALRPFERPRRAHQIGVAYQRWQTAMSRPTPTNVEVQKPDPSVESAESSQSKDTDDRHPSRSRRPLLSAGVAAFVAAAAGGALLWWSGGTAQLPAATGPGILEQARELSSIGIAWAADRLARGGAVPEPAADLSSESTTPSAPRAARRVVRSVTAERGGSVRLGETTPHDPEGVDPSSASPSGIPGAFALDEIVIRARAVYTSADADVQPPVAVRPQMPPTSHLDPSRPDVASMEILVSPTGAVEHVSLGPGPSRMSHVMLLSAAKTWQFEPATRDGHPVPYRLRQLWLVTR